MGEMGIFEEQLDELENRQAEEVAEEYLEEVEGVVGEVIWGKAE